MIETDRTQFAPLCLDALTARIAEQAGFKTVYVSGGALGYAHAVSEALLSLDELADVVRHIRARSEVQIVCDAGVGFGDAVHVQRTIQSLEAAGADAIEIEDQVAPKQVSHHRGIEHLISTDEMVGKICVAVKARRLSTTQIIARTGAVKNESLSAGISRCQAYVAAGADMILVMAETDADWQRISAAVGAPLVTFGAFAGPGVDVWGARGVSLVLDPFTTQVAQVQNLQETYRCFFAGDDQPLALKDVFSTYHQMDEIAGFNGLYDIEDATTLADSSSTEGDNR